MISSNMSTTTVSSLAFYKPRSIYDTIRTRDFFHRKSDINVSDDNIFGREKLNYVYDVPRNLNPPRSDKKAKESCKKLRFQQPGVALERATNNKSNGLHLCQEADKIRR